MGSQNYQNLNASCFFIFAHLFLPSATTTFVKIGGFSLLSSSLGFIEDVNGSSLSLVLNLSFWNMKEDEFTYYRFMLSRVVRISLQPLMGEVSLSQPFHR